MAGSRSRSSVEVARCPAAGSLTIALNRAVKITFAEFRIRGDCPLVKGDDCSALEESWKKACSCVLQRTSGRRERLKRRLGSALKSCKRLFDISCPPCDKKAGGMAREKWDRHVALHVPQDSLDRCESLLPALRARVRVLVDGWGRRLDERRVLGGEPYLGEYIPDQQGCYEVSAGQGGTLACGEEEYSGDWGLLRRGVAKTKGKHRVVTMQSAEVKRVLTPVHNALYDHISSFGWCVRGDVLKEDFESVLDDRREGEETISGDYQSATDNIFLPAVEAVVGVLLECQELSWDERRILYGSFTDLRWRSRNGAQHPIRRGSMMGNLVSFPLLCLINKASFDIACDGHGVGSRVGRFNGDDCVFNGDSLFFGRWSSVVSAFGLVVNKEKTGVSRRWMELNSSTYDANQHRFVAKPVLSFLLPPRSAPGTILPSVISGISSFSWRVQQWIVKVLMRYEITLRGVRAGLSSLGPRWRSELVRLRWFRAACLNDAPPVRERGVDRDLPVVVGPPPDPRIYSFISRCSSELSRERVCLWRGVRVVPRLLEIDRQNLRSFKRRFQSPRLSSLFKWGGWSWTFVYPREVFEFLSDNFPNTLKADRSKWRDDHPFLSRRPVVFEERRATRPSWRDPVFSSTFCSEYPLGHR